MLLDSVFGVLPALPAGLPAALYLLIPIAAFLLIRLTLGSSNKNLPPGPEGWPVLGNIVDIVRAGKSKRLHLLFENWARQYGDVMRIRSGLEDEYYVNSRRAAKQIMDTNSIITAERPRWIVSCEHVCGNWNMLLLSASNPRWKASHPGCVRSHSC